MVILKTGVSLKTVVDLWSATKLTFLTQQDHKPANQKLKESNTFWLHFKNPERKGSKTSKKTETFEIVWYHFPNPLSKKIWTFEEKKSKRSREMDQTWKMNLASSSMRAYLNTHTHTHSRSPQCLNSVSVSQCDRGGKEAELGGRESISY